MWKALQNKWLPKKFYSWYDYFQIQRDYNNNTNKYSNAEKGFVGYVCSFRNLFFHSYNTSFDQKREYQKLARYRCLYNESYKKENEDKNVNLDNIVFKNLDYTKLTIPKDSIVYCDAPYRDTTTDGYLTKDFDYNKYYVWLLETATNNEVYVSELDIPSDDFEIIWEKTHAHQLNNKDRNVTEKLYKVKKTSIQRIRKLNTFIISFFYVLSEEIKIVINKILENVIIIIFQIIISVEFYSNSP